MLAYVVKTHRFTYAGKYSLNTSTSVVRRTDRVLDPEYSLGILVLHERSLRNVYAFDICACGGQL